MKNRSVMMNSCVLLFFMSTMWESTKIGLLEVVTLKKVHYRKLISFLLLFSYLYSPYDPDCYRAPR